EAHLAGRLAQSLAVEVPELQQTALTGGQQGKVGRRQGAKGAVVIDGDLDQAPPTPAAALTGLGRFDDLAEPILPSRPGSVAGVNDREAGWQGDRGSGIVCRRIDDANPACCQVTVRATAKPTFSAEAVDDRASNSRAGERLKRNASGRVEA